MALMRVQVDKRAFTGIASGGNTTYAHGLGAAPDAVLVRFANSIASTASNIIICAAIDANNVTLYNDGNVASQNIEACAMRFHSLIQ